MSGAACSQQQRSSVGNLNDRPPRHCSSMLAMNLQPGVSRQRNNCWLGGNARGEQSLASARIANDGQLIPRETMGDTISRSLAKALSWTYDAWGNRHRRNRLRQERLRYVSSMLSILQYDSLGAHRISSRMPRQHDHA